MLEEKKVFYKGRGLFYKKRTQGQSLSFHGTIQKIVNFYKKEKNWIMDFLILERTY